MSYRDAIQFLCSLQLFGAKPGLERTVRLAELAGRPQDKLRFIHVAGTNGKGSTCAMLESIYRAAGLRVGLYTSPHLVSFRERIQINRELVSEEHISRFVGEAQPWLREFSPENHPTFFEVVTLVALRCFAELQCDLVIWETGLGGRLDATNIVVPLVSVITNVEFDHEKWLGHTLEEIAREKAGIIKPRVPVVTGESGDAALRVIRETAEAQTAPLHLVQPATVMCPVGLAGEHQRLNAAMAVRTVEVLERVIPVPQTAIRAGLDSVQWPGRFQILRRGTQTIVLDGAHNPAGAAALVKTLRTEFQDAALTFIVGVLADKNWGVMIGTLARDAHQMICVPVESARTALPVSLAAVAKEANPPLNVFAAASLAEALSLSCAARHVVVTGSLYLIGEALELLGENSAANERTLNEWSARPR